MQLVQFIFQAALLFEMQSPHFSQKIMKTCIRYGSWHWPEPPFCSTESNYMEGQITCITLDFNICKCAARLSSTRKFSPPTGGFFLAPAEGWRALRPTDDSGGHLQSIETMSRPTDIMEHSPEALTIAHEAPPDPNQLIPRSWRSWPSQFGLLACPNWSFFDQYILKYPLVN